MCKYAAVTVTERIMLKGKTNKEDIVLKFYRIMVFVVVSLMRMMMMQYIKVNMLYKGIEMHMMNSKRVIIRFRSFYMLES